MDARRGFVPEDEQWFSGEAMEKLRRASRHIGYLVEEGYDLKTASTFVGNHFLLSQRQRLAIVRSLCSRKALAHRREKEKAPGKLLGEEVWMDGFNTVITWEVFLCGSPLFLGMDGTIRDLACLRGSYRLISETKRALELILELLKELGVGGVHVLLDEPVSNSGRLKVLLAQMGEGYPFSLDIQILRDVDRFLYDKENVVTTDGIILDHCKSWINLSAKGIREKGGIPLKVWE